MSCDSVLNTSIWGVCVCVFKLYHIPDDKVQTWPQIFNAHTHTHTHTENKKHFTTERIIIEVSFLLSTGLSNEWRPCEGVPANQTQSRVEDYQALSLSLTLYTPKTGLRPCIQLTSPTMVTPTTKVSRVETTETTIRETNATCLNELMLIGKNTDQTPSPNRH